MKRSELFFTFILLPLDIAMFILAFVFAFFTRSRWETTPFSSDFGLHTYLVYCIVLIPVMILLFGLNGLYNTRVYNGIWQQLYRVFVAASVTILFLIVFIFLSKSLFFSRLILVFTWVYAIATISFGRLLLMMIQRNLLRVGIGVRNVLIIGNNSVASTIASELSDKTYASYKVVGIALDGDDGNGTESTFRVLGNLDNIALLIKKYKIDEVILADTTISKKKIPEIIQICEDQKVSFKYVPDLFSMMTSSFKPTLIASTPVMELKTIPLDGWGRIIKRMFDIVLALISLIIFSPVFAVIALLVKLTSPGPVFYRHERIGRDEKKFLFYKFRSMYFDKCDYKGGVYWTTKEDEKTRITPVGLVIRKTNLDELPQFWNILIGNMSFVGPRPELPKLVEKFEKDIPEYFRRHRVKSGLTGWAQVNGLKGDTSVQNRIRYDLYYIENWSLWFDLKIILKTIGLTIYEALNGKSEYRTRP